jgi:RNA polymerase sigma-70 factor (ECF subfamily)
MFGSRSRQEPFDRDSDVEIYRAAAQGNGEAMALLYQRYGSLIYRFSLRLSRDESIAEEVTQDVFVAILKEGARYDPRCAAPSTWMCAIARRLVWKHLDRRQRHAPMEDSSQQTFPSPNDEPDIALGRNQAIAAVQRGIDELPPEFREVVILCEFEEMKYGEVALVLGVPVGTVRSRLHRAKARLALLLRGTAARESKERASC